MQLAFSHAATEATSHGSPALIGRDPTPSSGARLAIKVFCDSLALLPPPPSDPGHWHSGDGFLQVSVSVIKDLDLTADRELRVLVTFDGQGIQDRCKQILHERLPEYGRMSLEQRRNQWVEILRIGKEVRTERVLEIIGALHARGVEADPRSVVVHRVSNSFFVNLPVRSLSRLLELRKGGEVVGVRRLQVPGWV